MASAFAADLVLEEPAASWNVAPTQRIAVVRVADDEGPQRVLSGARWGLVPSWSKEIGGPPLINARAETLTTKPAFRAAARRHRAIVPANGYFEWAPGTPKTPYFLHAPADGLLGFAGVCEFWQGPDGWLCSTAIVTRATTDALGHIHDRMPVVVPRDLVDAWLDPSLTSADGVDALLHSIPDPELTPRPADHAVGSVRNNYPGLIGG